jgi:hypothetical protein
MPNEAKVISPVDPELGTGSTVSSSTIFGVTVSPFQVVMSTPQVRKSAHVSQFQTKRDHGVGQGNCVALNRDARRINCSSTGSCRRERPPARMLPMALWTCALVVYRGRILSSGTPLDGSVNLVYQTFGKVQLGALDSARAVWKTCWLQVDETVSR